MIHPNTPINDVICSKVWLNPIAPNQSASGVEKLGLEMEMHAYDAQTLAPLGTKNSSLDPQAVLQEIVPGMDSS